MTIYNFSDKAATLPMPSPKVSATLRGRASWYPFYAGYSPEFVKHVLENADLQPGAKVLDSWNGSGTTTQIAAELGFSAIGVDLNPVMVVVARARLLQKGDVSTLRALTKKLARTIRGTGTVPESDGLSLWLDDASASEMRAVEQRIRALSNSDPLEQGPINKSVANACFFLTGLFRTVRRIMAPLRGTNPTWIRRPSPATRLSIPRGTVVSLLAEEIAAMIAALESESPDTGNIGRTEIMTGTSTALPLEDSSVHLVVTSPPYCTRIDYAVTTSVELATLGVHSDNALRDVRDKMIGTTTIRAQQPTARESWGPTCLRLLGAIRDHDSHASATYYLKTHQQYFHDIDLSLAELNRCLVSGGEAIIVVQDSYYKNIRNDVPTIVSEMCADLGWSLVKRVDFPVTRNLVGINGRAKKYVEERSAVEVVLHFRK